MTSKFRFSIDALVGDDGSETKVKNSPSTLSSSSGGNASSSCDIKPSKSSAFTATTVNLSHGLLPFSLLPGSCLAAANPYIFGASSFASGFVPMPSLVVSNCSGNPELNKNAVDLLQQSGRMPVPSVLNPQWPAAINLVEMYKQSGFMPPPFFSGGPDPMNGHQFLFRKPKRIRTAFSPHQLLELEKAFDKNHYVVGAERKTLAQQLALTETQVKVWFQNRRTKHKRIKNEGDSSKSHEDGSRASSPDDQCGSPGSENLNISDDDDDDDDEPISESAVLQ